MRYNVLNWLEKNKDPLNDTVVSVMKATTGNGLLNVIWEDYTTQEEAAQKAKGSSKLIVGLSNQLVIYRRWRRWWKEEG